MCVQRNRDFSWSHEQSKDPLHCRVLNRLLQLVIHHFSGFFQFGSEVPFSNRIHKQAEHHNHGERLNSALFLQKHLSNSE